MRAYRALLRLIAAHTRVVESTENTDDPEKALRERYKAMCSFRRATDSATPDDVDDFVDAMRDREAKEKKALEVMAAARKPNT